MSVIGAVLTAGCLPANPVVTQTLTVIPTSLPVMDTPNPTYPATPTLMPTLIQILRPTPTLEPTLIPTLQPISTKAVTSNISPFTPSGWVLPVLATAKPGVHQLTDLSVDGDTYVSWFAINNGLYAIDYKFYVDMFLDEVFAERWVFDGIEVNQTVGVIDWDGLAAKINLQAGTHILKLVLDSTNLVPETDETDNVYELEFTWGDSSLEPSPPLPSPSNLPDLVPFTPKGWTDPLIATSYSGDIVDGPLSVDVPTYLRYAFINQSTASTPGEVWAHIYLDDILVTTQLRSGPLAEEIVASSEWGALFNVMNVTPGAHTLRLEIDPTNLIIEGDESNNTIEKKFIWGVGGVPNRLGSEESQFSLSPTPLNLPNLVPGWRLGWDGPIIISHEPDTFLNSQLTVDRNTFVDVVVHNESIIDVEQTFSVDLYFDDYLVHTFSFSGGMEPNRLVWVSDWDGLLSVTNVDDGSHTMRMVIDPDNRIKEADESDNIHQVNIIWRTNISPSYSPIVYNPLELQQKLAKLGTILNVRGSTLNSDGYDYTREVIDITDAGYHLLTGRSIWDERVDIYLLSRKDYLSWIDDYYSEQYALNNEEKYDDLQLEQEKIKSLWGGLNVSRFGKIAIVINAERDPADVIGFLAHELGHVYQGFINSDQNQGAHYSYQMEALREAQAQQFERAFWLSLEDFTGLSLLTYPYYQGFRNFIWHRFDSWSANPRQDEHFLGYLLQWLAVLHDPNLADLKHELVTMGRLGLNGSLDLYDYMIHIPGDSIEAYVNSLVHVMDSHIDIIKILSMSRLVSDLHPDKESSPDLRGPALLSP